LSEKGEHSKDKEKEYLEGRKQLEFLKSLLNQPLFLQAVDSLGRVPRFLQFFLTKLVTAAQKQDLKEFLSGVLDSVVDEVQNTYGTKKWDDFFSGSPNGVRNMILWALSGKEVSLRDKLNGITVEQACSTGILMLEEVKGSYPTKYIINVPLVLLQALNKQLRDVRDSDLNPVRIIDDREFERVMSTLRTMRQNMLVKSGNKTATYRELYPHALGYDEDLDQEIPLQKLEDIRVDGSSAKHDSMHQFPMNAIPVLDCPQKVMDVSQGGLLVQNVPKAPSNDVLIVHPPSHIEGIQYKSSDNITRSMEPDPNSKGILELGNNQGSNKKTIWAEFNKVTDSDHKKFYSSLGEPKFNLFVVSNKPLKGYEDIRKAVATKDYKNGLPKGVVVVCHQNFHKYARLFAHRGLYLPLKRKQESGGKEETKKLKMEDEM